MRTIYYYRMDPRNGSLCSRGPPPSTRFTLPVTRERCLSMTDIGEKERDILLKELYKLKSNNLMSSLRSQIPLEYPQMHSPSFRLCPVCIWGTPSQKKKSVVLLCPSRMVPKRCCMAAVPGFKSQHQSSFTAPFLTPPTIRYTCQHSCIFPALLGCLVSLGRCGPVVWSQPSPSSYTGSVTRGSYIWESPSYIMG